MAGTKPSVWRPVAIVAAAFSLFWVSRKAPRQSVWIETGSAELESPAVWGAIHVGLPEAGVRTLDAALAEPPEAGEDARDAVGPSSFVPPSGTVEAERSAWPEVPAAGAPVAGGWPDRESAFLRIVAARRRADGRARYTLASAIPMIPAVRRAARPTRRELLVRPEAAAPIAGRPSERRGLGSLSAIRGAPHGTAAQAPGGRRPRRSARLAGRSSMSSSAGETGSEEARLPALFSGLIRDFKERFSRRQSQLPPPPRLSLRLLLGKGPLRPPRGTLVAPDFSKLRIPAAPDGRRIDPVPPGPSDVEGLETPEQSPAYEIWRREPRSGAHWHSLPQQDYYHAGSRWGRLCGNRWTWFVRSGEHWWTNTRATPMVRYMGHWWWKTSNGWFLLHEGQPWAYRLFTDVQQDGLWNPQSRARLIYSDDARRVALQAPGRPTVVYDVETGAVVGRLPPESRTAAPLRRGPRP